MLSKCPLTFCCFSSHCPSAPPQASAPQPAPAAQPVDEGEAQAGPSGGAGGGGGIESGAEEEQCGRRSKVKTPRWIQACMHYRFPASIDPFTSENTAENAQRLHL